MARCGPAGPAAPGRMARAARLCGADPRALLLPLLLLLLPPPPLLARTPWPPVSAQSRSAAPRRGGAGHSGWAQWPSWTHRGSWGGLERPVTRTAFWVPRDVKDSELPVRGGVQVEPAPGSFRLVRRDSVLDARPLPTWGPAPRPPSCRSWIVCWAR